MRRQGRQSAFHAFTALGRIETPLESQWLVTAKKQGGTAVRLSHHRVAVKTVHLSHLASSDGAEAGLTLLRLLLHLQTPSGFLRISCMYGASVVSVDSTLQAQQDTGAPSVAAIVSMTY